MSSFYYTDKCTLYLKTTDKRGQITTTTVTGVKCRFHDNHLEKPGPQGKMIQYRGVVALSVDNPLKIGDQVMITEMRSFPNPEASKMEIKQLKKARLFGMIRQEAYLS